MISIFMFLFLKTVYFHYMWEIELRIFCFGSKGLKGLYRKNERGYRLRANHLIATHKSFISDVPVSRSWCKTVSNFYDNSYIYSRTPTNESAIYWSCVSVCINWPVYCTIIGWSSNNINIFNYIYQK